jgi:hypothetical protein
VLHACLSTGSGDEEHIEWPKIHTPTDEVVVPYDTIDAPPEGVCRDGMTIFLFTIMLFLLFGDGTILDLISMLPTMTGS